MHKPDVQDEILAEEYWRKKLHARNFNPLFLENAALEPGDSERLVYSFELPEKNALLMQSIASNDPSGIFIISLVSLAVLYHKYTNQDRLLMATPSFFNGDRTIDDRQSLLFIDVALEESSTLRDLLTPCADEINQVNERDFIGFDTLTRILTTHNVTDPRILPYLGLYLSDFNNDSCLDRINLLFKICRKGAGFSMAIQYSCKQFTESQVRALAHHYIAVNADLMANLDKPIKEIQYLTEEEIRTLLFSFNQTDWVVKGGSVLDLFQRQVREFPSAPAVRINQEMLTYHQLNEQSSKLAGALIRDKKVKSGERIAVKLDKGMDTVICILAIFKIGAIYVPIDPALPKNRVDFMLMDTAARVLITHSDYMFDVDTDCVGLVVMDVEKDEILAEPIHDFCGEGCSEAYLIYTSGTSGYPKGVIMEHKGLLNTVDDHIRQLSLGVGDCVLQFMALSFDGSLLDLFKALGSGACAVLIDKETIHDPAKFVRYITENRISVLTLPPAYLAFVPPQLDAVRHIISAGEKAIAKDLLKHVGRANCYNGYGPTELAINSTLYKANESDWERGYLPIGKPSANKKVYILDNNLHLVPLGASGEICLAGVGISPGYLNNVGLTTEKFVQNPFIGGEMLYKTGDLGHWQEDGNLVFDGRKDDQVKLRGFRIELSEITTQLSNYPGVKQCQARLVDIRNNPALVVYYVADAPLEKQALRGFLQRSLPDYMVPNFYEPLDRFPVTVNGKINWSALPIPHDPLDSSERELPQNALEESLISIWKEVLEVAELGTTEDFFSLGGDSIKGIRMVNLIQNWLGDVVQLSTIFENPTIKDLALILDSRVQARHNEENLLTN